MPARTMIARLGLLWQRVWFQDSPTTPLEISRIGIAAAMLLVHLLRVSPEHYRKRVVWPASAAIAAMGIFWTITRLPWFQA